MWMGGASCDSIAIARHGAFLPLYRLAVILAHSADANRFDRAIAVTAQLAGLCSMDWPDYLRDQAAKYRQLAEQTDDAVINDELLEWAASSSIILCIVSFQRFSSVLATRRLLGSASS